MYDVDAISVTYGSSDHIGDCSVSYDAISDVVGKYESDAKMPIDGSAVMYGSLAIGVETPYVGDG